MTRASMLAVLASDFVRTARASGLSPTRSSSPTRPQRHAAVITTLSMVFSFLLGPMCWWKKYSPGPASALRGGSPDLVGFRAVQGFVLTMAVMYVLLNLIIDILYGVIDPRVRLEG